MNLIEKYVSEVGKYLPRKNRADIEAEIRSTLEDMLDERTQASGATDPADEATVLALLKEYGAPREVAATYKPQQYLIGPRLFPIFEMVLRIVLVVVVSASVIGLAVGLARTGFSGPEFVSSLGEWFGGLFNGLIAAFGNIVLIFAIMERTQLGGKFQKEIDEWDPKELQSEPDPDRIDMPDHIATIIFTTLGLVVLNLYPNLLVFGYMKDGNWVSFPLLTETFFRFLPWMNIMGLLQIIFSGFMLSQRDWTPVTRLGGIAVDIASMVLSIVILRTPGIFGINPQSLTAAGITDAAETLSRLFNFIPTMIIIIVVIATAAKVGKTLLRIFNYRSKSPYPVSR